MASLTGWKLVVVLLALGTAAYFAISTLLRIAASLIPAVSLLGALAIVAWVLLASQHEHAEPE